MCSPKQSKQDSVIDGSRQELAAHISAAVDGPVDSGTFLGAESARGDRSCRGARLG